MEGETLTRAAEELASADALVIGAGAGMGVDSGLPSFRGPSGFWAAYPACARLNLSFAEIANPAWFQRDPGLVWAFYGHRLQLYRQAEPHSGFHALLKLAQSRTAGYFVFTSNVDGHFQKAGFEPGRIVECHGSIHHLQCAQSCSPAIWEAAATDLRIDPERFRALPPLPACPSCGGLARPNILMFGDAGWNRDRTCEQTERMEEWLDNLPPSSKVATVELGAGTAIPTVRYTCEAIARRFRGMLVRVNPDSPEAPPGAFSIRLGAREALMRLCSVSS